MLLRDLSMVVLVLSCLALSWFFHKNMMKHKNWRFMMGLPFLGALIHLALYGLNALMLPVYLASFLLLILLIKPLKRLPQLLVTSLILLLSLLPSVAVKSGYPSANYASLSYEESFEKMNSYFSEHYALKEWKHIDFDQKYKTYLPLFESAEKNKSKTEYYIALNKYLNSFGDSHMEFGPLTQLAFKKQPDYIAEARANISHYDYGFTMARTDEGQYIATLVDEKREVAQKGMKNGSVITQLNGVEIQAFAEAFENPVWYLTFPNMETEKLVNSYYMGTSLGKDLTVTFIDSSDQKEKTVAVKDSPISSRTYAPIFNALYGIEATNSKENLTCKLTEEGHGYIFLKDFKSDDFKGISGTLKKNIEDLNNQGAKDLIIDIRNNGGGFDELGAAITGLFTKKDQFYINEAVYNSKTKAYETKRTLTATSQYAGFDKPVVVLFNSNSCSAAEGFAYNMGKLEQVTTAGITPTNGSFGTIETGILMPDNFVVLYPSIICTDEKGKVLIDSDEDRLGGVVPELKIPLDTTAIQALFEEKRDYELEYVKEYLEKNR